MRGMSRHKLVSWAELAKGGLEDFDSPNIIDVRPIKKPTLGQLWYLFCGSLLYLAFLAIAIPILGGVLLLMYYLIKVAIFG